ncbi:MAG TPA: ABC transporter ATP-binding protein [Candidatus Binataceae bacterium]
MAELAARNLTRRFASGGGISDISLTVATGEFMVLLGPSGCGKSTLLRLIAGLEQPDSGTIEFASGGPGDGGRRAIAMVFQNFALYPHMTAFENIAFPLRLRRTPRDEIEARVALAADTAGLKIELRRYPAELSGGERQRVALARALVREPAVILMDEPLSSLDARLRGALRLELKEFQRKVRRTIVYVTHDQAEAFGLADRIAVMCDGRIEQVGSPEEIYQRPATAFVAGFVGSPPMNLFRARRAAEKESLIADGISLPAPVPRGAGDEVTVGFRPIDIAVADAPNLIAIAVEVEDSEFTGSGFLVRCRAGSIVLHALFEEKPARGERRTIFVDPVHLHFFDSASGRRLE